MARSRRIVIDSAKHSGAPSTDSAKHSGAPSTDSAKPSGAPSIDGVPYRYSRRHVHVAGPAGSRLCEEVLRAWTEDGSQGTLVLRFRDQQGGATLAGGGWGGHDGALLIDDEHVNLNLPRVVAALLQAARALPQPPPRQTLELDGFALWRRRSRETP